MISENQLDVLCSINKEKFFLPLSNTKRQYLVKTLARNSEAHNYNVQMQVRQLEHEADARFSPKTKGTVIANFLRKQVMLLKISEKFW